MSQVGLFKAAGRSLFNFFFVVPPLASKSAVEYLIWRNCVVVARDSRIRENKLRLALWRGFFSVDQTDFFIEFCEFEVCALSTLNTLLRCFAFFSIQTGVLYTHVGHLSVPSTEAWTF